MLSVKNKIFKKKSFFIFVAGTHTLGPEQFSPAMTTILYIGYEMTNHWVWNDLGTKLPAPN